MGGEDSIRIIAERHSIDTTMMAERARKERWVKQRRERQAAIAQRTAELLIEQHAHERADALYVADRVVRKFLNDIDNGNLELDAKTALEFLKFREVLTGGVSNRTEQSSNLTVSQYMEDTGLQIADVVRFLESAQPKLIDAGGSPPTSVGLETEHSSPESDSVLTVH